MAKYLKTKLLVGNTPEGDGQEFIDFYVEKDFFTNFYIPTTEDGEEPCVNVMKEGFIVTFLQTKKLIQFLTYKIVEDSE